MIWSLLPMTSTIEPACCVCGTPIRREMRFAVIEDEETGCAGLAHWICDINVKEAEAKRNAQQRAQKEQVENALKARGYTNASEGGVWIRRMTGELDMVVSNGEGEAPERWQDCVLSVHPICGEAAWDADVTSEEELDQATLEAWRIFGKRSRERT